MSKGAKIAVLLWTLVVLVSVGVFLYSELRSRTYSGSKVAFTAGAGRYIDIDTAADTIRIEAADSEFFRIVQGGETHRYGEPETPPLDYERSNYFRLKAQLQKGRWEVAEGSSISIVLTGDQSFSVTYSPTNGKVAEEILGAAIAGTILWLVGLLFGVAISISAS